MTKTKNAPALAADPVARARERVADINAQERKFATLFRQKQAELAELRANRGRQVLSAADPSAITGEINSRIRSVEDECEALAEAAAAARPGREEAIAALYETEANDLERQATELEAKAAENEALVAERLKALEAVTDWPYVPVSPTTGPSRPHGGIQGGSLILVDARGPIFQRLRVDAETLRRRAVQVRLQQPHRAGSIEADTLEDLIETLFSDPMRIGPSVEAVSAWVQEAATKELARRRRIDHGEDCAPADAPMRFHLEWRNGAIDVAGSHVLTPNPQGPDSAAVSRDVQRDVSGSTIEEIDTEADFALASSTAAAEGDA